MSVGKTADRPRGGRLSRLAAYGSARTAVELMFGLRGVVLARILGPGLFGIWTLFRLGLRYGAFASLGVHRGLELEVAAEAGEQAPDERRQWGRAALAFLFSVYVAIGVLLIAASLFFASPTRETLQVLALALLVERLWVYGSSYLRAEGRLRRFGAVELAQAASSLVLTAVMAMAWGLVGAYLGFLLAMVTGIALLGRTVPFRPRMARPRVRRLFQVGVPLSIAAVVNTLLATVDRLIVAGLEGAETLGFYAFAVAVSGIGASAAWIVRTVVFPEVYARARSEGGAEAAATHLHDTIVPVAHLLPALLGLLAFALGPAVALAAPEYVVVVPVARLFIFTGVAAGIMSLGTLGLVATERQRSLPVVAVAGLLLNAASALFALRAGLGLMGVAAGALVGRSLTGAGIVALSMGLAASPRELVRIGLRLLGPTAWCAVVVVTIGWWRPSIAVGSTAVSAGLYLVALLPLLPDLVVQFRRLARH
jgi:O-antigen/teichoic acid export membrane protein